MYLTYEQYKTMGGTMEEPPFNDLEFEAESIVNWYTFNRLLKETKYPESLTKLMFRLVQMGYLRQQAFAVGRNGDSISVISNGAISSQSNDGYSTQFNVLSASDALSVTNNEIDSLVKYYLQGVTNSLGHRLLYRGVYPDE